jgi:hypothetical protein
LALVISAFSEKGQDILLPLVVLESIENEDSRERDRRRRILILFGFLIIP